MGLLSRTVEGIHELIERMQLSPSKDVRAAQRALIRSELVVLLSDPPPELRTALVDLVEQELDERQKQTFIQIGRVDPLGQRPSPQDSAASDDRSDCTGVQ